MVKNAVFLYNQWKNSKFKFLVVSAHVCRIYTNLCGIFSWSCAELPTGLSLSAEEFEVSALTPKF